MPKAAGASVTKSGKGSADLGYWLVGPRGNHRLLTPCTPLRVTPRDRVDDQYIPWECIARLEPIFYASCPCANNLIALILRLTARYEVDMAFHWLSRYANYAADRLCTGASPVVLTAEGATGIPRVVVHTTIHGLPCDFLRGASNSVVWKRHLWLEAHPRR